MTHTIVFITETMILYRICSVILATLILTGRSYIYVMFRHGYAALHSKMILVSVMMLCKSVPPMS